MTLSVTVILLLGIHGDEVVGRELLLYLARVFCEQYNHDQVITELMQSIELHILPSLNVDGFVLKTRNNVNDRVRVFSVFCDLIFYIKIGFE